MASALLARAEPVVTSALPRERDWTIASVVLSTGIDRDSDLDEPDQFAVYHGMAESRSGVALPGHAGFPGKWPLVQLPRSV